MSRRDAAGSVSTPDPLALLAADRRRAREENDPWANLCVLATVTAAGEPAARVLVLRDVNDRLGVFFNATSPKADEARRSRSVAVLIYLPAASVQYRLQCALEPIAAEVVHGAWQQRPDIPKRMDWFYQTHPQSSAFGSRDALLEAVAGVALPEPLVAPASAAGCFLAPAEIERLHLAPGAGAPSALHDRRRYALRRDGSWMETALVP